MDRCTECGERGPVGFRNRLGVVMCLACWEALQARLAARRALGPVASLAVKRPKMRQPRLLQVGGRNYLVGNQTLVPGMKVRVGEHTYVLGDGRPE